jgi:hypothetical protein
MDENLKKRIDELWLQAKKTGKKDVKATLKSGNENSLNNVIKTQEQADLFMKMLKALK